MPERERGALVTGCTASRFGDHDYSEPPHNTPDDPRDAEDTTPCQAQLSRAPFPPCEHERRYELVVYQPGSHDWIRMFACTPCTATLRQSKARMLLGPPGNREGVARICTARQDGDMAAGFKREWCTAWTR
jgi:hypothetical protein